MTLNKILIFYLKVEFINLINITINKFDKYLYSNIIKYKFLYIFRQNFINIISNINYCLVYLKKKFIY